MHRHLSASQHRTITALAETVAPRSAHLPLSATDAGVADALDRLLRDFDPASRRLIRLLATALRFAPLMTGAATSFPRMPAAERAAYLRKVLARPGLDHDVALNLRTICEMLYAGDARFRAHVGDFGEPFKTGVPTPPETPLQVTCHPQLAADTTVECDVAIVGSGAGGATIAREFAEAGIDVVVIEEGPPVERGDFRAGALERVTKYYRANGLSATFGTPMIPVPMGRVVGGTTVVNSGTCLRAPDSLLHSWATKHGATLAAPQGMGKAYDFLTERLNIRPVGDDIMGNNGMIARRGAQELGLRGHPIPRPTRDCVGSGQCAFGCPRDAKQAMHLANLPEAVRRGTRIFALCRVERLLSAGRRIDGIVARILDASRRPTGHELTVRAKAVFLCAGALCTPSLLMRHGLGASGRALGRRLRIHPGSGITGRFTETVNGWQGVMQSFAIDEHLEEGVLLEATFPPLGMSYSAAALPGVGDEHAELLGSYAHMASIGSIVSDTSEGRVRNLPGAGPIMQYRMNPEDVKRTVAAIALAARVLFAAGAREVYPGVPEVPVLRSPREVEDFERHPFRAKNLKVSAYHPMGTACMGSDPSRSVCDPTGRVHDSTNLYVADTSLFPGSTHVNPQLTLMALCLNLARRFVDGWPGVAQHPPFLARTSPARGKLKPA